MSVFSVFVLLSFFFFLFLLSVAGFANTYTVDGAKDVKDGLFLFFFFLVVVQAVVLEKVLDRPFSFFFF